MKTNKSVKMKDITKTKQFKKELEQLEKLSEQSYLQVEIEEKTKEYKTLVGRKVQSMLDLSNKSFSIIRKKAFSDGVYVHGFIGLGVSVGLLTIWGPTTSVLGTMFYTAGCVVHHGWKKFCSLSDIKPMEHTLNIIEEYKRPVEDYKDELLDNLMKNPDGTYMVSNG